MKKSDCLKAEIVFLFKTNSDKRLQTIADTLGISMTYVAKVLDEFLKMKPIKEIKEEEEYIIFESKMNYDRD